MTPRKYNPPLKVKPEPTTRRGVIDLIAELEAEIKGGGLDGAVLAHITRLKKILEGLKCA